MVTKDIFEFKKIQEKYQPKALDFMYNSGYLLQACRNGLHTYKSDETMIIYTTRNTDARPNKVIVASAGKNIEQTMTELAKALEEPVVAKNVNKDLEEKLKKEGWRNYKTSETWDEFTDYDDNTFPEQVVATKEYVNLKGSKYSSLRAELKRFNKKYKISMHEYKSPDEYYPLLEKWADQMIKRNDLNREELIRSHTMFGKTDEGFIQKVFKDSKGNIIGFISLSESSKKCLGYNALVCDFSYKNLYRKMMYEGIKLAHELGYEYINLQGSEDKAQYSSKRRFKAEIELLKTHMIYDLVN